MTGDAIGGVVVVVFFVTRGAEISILASGTVVIGGTFGASLCFTKLIRGLLVVSRSAFCAGVSSTFAGCTLLSTADFIFIVSEAVSWAVGHAFVIFAVVVFTVSAVLAIVAVTDTLSASFITW